MNKFIINIFCVLSLFSCSYIDKNRIAPGYVEAFNSLKLLVYGDDSSIAPEVIKEIPYASMLVKIGNGPKALMILEKISDDEYTWVSADEIYLVTRNGRIIKTAGLPNNLKEIISPFNGWNSELFRINDFVSYKTFTDPPLNNLEVVSNYFLNNPAEEDLLFGSKTLKLIEEEIYSGEVGWSETNKYWLDNDNFVWKSVQHISPRLPEIYIEITKKPR